MDLEFLKEDIFWISIVFKTKNYIPCMRTFFLTVKIEPLKQRICSRTPHLQPERSSGEVTAQFKTSYALIPLSSINFSNHNAFGQEIDVVTQW